MSIAELQRAHGWPGTLVSAASTFSFLLTAVLVIFTDDLLARMDPEIRRRRTLDAIKRLLLRESLNQPLIVIG